MDLELFNRMKRKSRQGAGKCRVVAVAQDAKKDILGIAINTPAHGRYFPQSHSEQKLMNRYGKNIATITICRFGRAGDQLPIHPCGMCQDRANRMGIKIKTIEL